MAMDGRTEEVPLIGITGVEDATTNHTKLCLCELR